ncbi:MAG TPA: PfkB family carbohydrate kinase, partial [Trebonia sp.]|nr:PfkB family carbohydrate kinase [Trebonia sp.]
TPIEVRRVLDSPSTLVVKDGAVGVTSYRHDQLAYMAAAPVEVLEPTGAGDAYAAGYLFGLLRGMGESVRLRLGHRVAAEALRVVGDLGTLPSTTELLAEVGAHQEGSTP